MSDNAYEWMVLNPEISVQWLDTAAILDTLDVCMPAEEQELFAELN